MGNRWDKSAIAAILCAAIGIAIYIMPARTADSETEVRRFVQYTHESYGSPSCAIVELDSAELVPEGMDMDFAGYKNVFACYPTTPFSPRSLPVAVVFWVSALLLLVLRLRPVSTNR